MASDSALRKSFIQLHVAVFLAGLTAILGKLISINEIWLVWYRLLITVISLWALFAWRKQSVHLSWRAWGSIVLVGAVVAFHWVTFYGSIKHANVSIALVSFSLLGFFSSLTQPLILRKKLDPVELLLGLISVIGVALIFHFDARYTKGILLGVLSAFLAALFTVMNKRLLTKHSAETVTLFELSGGFLVLSVYMLAAMAFDSFSFVWPSPADWGWLLILSWLCTVLAFYLSLQALRVISPFTVNLTYNLEPVYGIILAFIFFRENESLHPSFYIGLFFVLAAVLIQMWRVRR
jgi:drug/metabolite transporter (DMT)-like permease